MEKIYILIPNTLENNIGFLKGSCETDENNSKFFLITSNRVYTKSPANFIGYCSNKAPNFENNHYNDWLHINTETNKISIGKHEETNPICVTYDFQSFTNTESFHAVETDTNNIFFNLVNQLKPSTLANNHSKGFDTLFRLILIGLNFLDQMLNKCHFVVKYSAVFKNLEKNVKNLQYTVKSLQDMKKSIRTGNILSSIITDLIIGFILLYFLMGNEIYIYQSIQQSTKYIVDGLKHVLNILMDSPAGLKLNYALNRTLAVFFFYHISLWRAFINIIFQMIPKLNAIFAIVGCLGFSFQIALAIDLISFLTFHVYCIYVYAARFYGIQIYAINALWKLFIGRKYNPLRTRVDSYQYSNNQLFVGTLAFTVFIFLLPTTILYYAVFTMFRLWIVTINQLLGKTIRVCESIPLYIIVLRLLQSTKLRGSVQMNVMKDKKSSTLQLHATLNFIPLAVLIKQNASPILSVGNVYGDDLGIKECLASICTGRLI